MYAFVDTKTTGFAFAGVQPPIVSVAWIIAGNPDQTRAFKHAIVRPEGFTIAGRAAAVHGITTACGLAEGLHLTDVFGDFAQDLPALAPRVICDAPTIAAKLTHIGRSARSSWPGESGKLADAFLRLFRSAMTNAHDAGGVVLACVQNFPALPKRDEMQRPAG